MLATTGDGCRLCFVIGNWALARLSVVGGANLNGAKGGSEPTIKKERKQNKQNIQKNK